VRVDYIAGELRLTISGLLILRPQELSIERSPTNEEFLSRIKGTAPNAMQEFLPGSESLLLRRGRGKINCLRILDFAIRGAYKPLINLAPLPTSRDAQAISPTATGMSLGSHAEQPRLSLEVMS
jgi:hypothetical protein